MVKSLFSTKSKKIIKILTFTIISFVYAGVVFSDEEYKAWTGDFMRMGSGARAYAMGNAYTAVDGDIYSAYYNPAGLSTMRNLQMALSFRYLEMDRNFRHFIIGNKIGPEASFAFSWINAGTEDIMGRDLNGNPTGSINDSRNSFSLSFAKTINQYLSVGLNTKLSYWKLAGDDAKAFGFDFGVLAKPVKNLSLSYVIRDINSEFKWSSERWQKNISGGDGQSMEKIDKFPVYWTGGIAYKTLGEKLTLSSTIESVEENPLGLDFGVSYEVNDRLILRTGLYNYTSDDELDSGSATFGFSIKATNSISVDYAYANDGVDNDLIHILDIVLSLGE